MKICALFALYIIYQSNNDSDKIQINIDIQTLKEITNVFNICSNHGIQEICDLIKILSDKNCFIYGYITGLKSISLNRNGDPYS